MQHLFQDHLDLDPDADLAQATRAIPAGAGVCLFASADDQPILLLRAAGLRAIVRNRLAEPDPQEKSRRTQLRPITKRVYFRQTYSAFETELAYFNIAQKLYPQRLKEFFPHLTAWFVQLDLNAQYPVFARSGKVDIPGYCYWGPFGTKNAADFCVDMLQDIFQLCRCPHLLADAPHASPCSYAQMQRCSSPCDGTVSPQQYRQQIDSAVNFLNNTYQQNLAELKQRMQSFAADREYEQAQIIKDQITKIKKLDSYACRWVAPLERFYVYAFQPGPPTKVPGLRAYQRTITPFIIGPGWIKQIEPFTHSDAPDACQSLIDHYQLNTLQESFSQIDQHSDLLAWACRFLYGSSSAKGLYIRADEITAASQLLSQINEYFKIADQADPSAGDNTDCDSAQNSSANNSDNAEPDP
ncbi:MAG: UvrB/UvrC motif-containing protein [Sedimentisphaerales bacterium]|nr:UvrB/UvrC motif-containing protein [Sedimentisphaerales bacterium]